MSINERLKAYGYHPGDYLFKCLRCSQENVGHKLSSYCKECAMECLIKDLDKSIQNLETYKNNVSPIHKFLLGMAPLNGVWFDESMNLASWRNELRKSVYDLESE